MPIKVIFECSGCWNKTAEGVDYVKSRFHGISGKGYGFGQWVVDDIADLAPEGWVAFDPHTQCTYCPDCWESINND